jgi:hypothetical protein
MTPLEILLLILVIVAIGGGWRYGPWRTPAVNLGHAVGAGMLAVVALVLIGRLHG